MTRPELTAESLLAHEPFVRAVVRALVRDEASVQDVVQETWLTALRRPPREGVSLRAWLARVAGNRARDAGRGARRRRRREEQAARPEALESVALTHERLAAQREVVDAVLCLDEPYRTVVLLRYWQGLAPAEIAARLERSAATVRSQLSRAHELLRGRLDTQFDGGRATWAGLLVPLVGEHARAAALAPPWSVLAGKAALAVGGVALVALVVGPWLVPSDAPVLALPAGLAGTGGSPSAASATATPILVVPPPLTPATSARRPVASEAAPARVAQLPALESRTTRELLELAVQVQRAIERMLLTPDERLVAEQAELLALPDTGVVRLAASEGGCDRPNLVRGGGAFYSFATRNHSYDAEPDVALRGGRLCAGFYGIQLGLLAEIGAADLARLSDRPGPRPPGSTAEQAEAWKMLWSDIGLEDAGHDSDFRRRTEQLTRPIAPSTSSTLLLRVFSPDEHDHLVALRPLAIDDTGCTLAWRVLRTWPVPGERGVRFDPRRGEHADVPPGPSSLDGMTLDELRDLLARIRERSRPALLEVPDDVRGRFSSAIGAAADGFAGRSGFTRILPREAWDPLVEECGGGAYVSFLRDSHAYGDASELELQSGRFSSGFAGNDCGLLLDVGEVPFAELGGVMSGGVPNGLGPREREAWDFLWTVRATIEDGGRVLAATDAARADELGLRRDPPALVGHTYLLRSVLFRTHDHLVAFTVVDGDETGLSLAWRSLRSWPVEQPPHRR